MAFIIAKIKPRYPNEKIERNRVWYKLHTRKKNPLTIRAIWLSHEYNPENLSFQNIARCISNFKKFYVLEK